MEDIIVKKKFWDKKQIIWTILTIIAIALVSVVFIKKYMDKKAITDQANIEEQIFKRIEALSNKDYVISKEDSKIIDNKIESLSNKDYIMTKEDSEIIGNRIKSLSQ